MKNIQIFKIVTVASMVLMSGCGKDFLSPDPNNLVTTDNYYATQADAIAATNAVYVPLLQLYNESTWPIGDIMSDNSDLGGGGGGDGSEILELDNFTLTSQNPVAKNYWAACYKGIERANIALNKIPGISDINISPDIKKRCLGEATFLRAFYYYELVRLFGDIPLYINPITFSESKTIKRSSAADVYSQIISDLSAAESMLPNTYSISDFGRVSAGTAKGMLASVYLTLNRNADAAAKAKEVIDNESLYGYGLNSNYGDNFSLTTENSKECLFAVQYRSNDAQWASTTEAAGSRMNTFFGPRFATPNIVQSGGYGFNIPTLEFYNEYERGSADTIIDNRRLASIWIPGDQYADANISYTQAASLTGSPNGFNVKKYFVPVTNVLGDDGGWTSALNANIMRYSEVLLIYAEAAGSASGKASIDRVRARAGLAALPTGLSDQQYLDAIYKERRIEFAFEMHRWYDLLRYPNDPDYFLKVMQAVGKSTQSKHRYLPIPQSEIDANPSLTQNPGY